MDKNIKQKDALTLSYCFCKIDRLAAWVLFFVIITYAITGYGMTKGFIDRQLSHQLHLAWLGGIGLIAFIIHTAWAIHLSLIRHKIWNKWSKAVLASFYILMTIFFFYLHFFYTGAENEKPEFNTNVVNQALTQDTTEITPVFTAASLKEYNGLNGQAAYVAIDGLVYDMSKVFRNGKHYGYSAGQDLSAEFHGEHPDSYLRGYEVVGTYQAE